jgi:hypothetical protein
MMALYQRTYFLNTADNPGTVYPVVLMFMTGIIGFPSFAERKEFSLNHCHESNYHLKVAPWNDIPSCDKPSNVTILVNSRLANIMSQPHPLRVPDAQGSS